MSEQQAAAPEKKEGEPTVEATIMDNVQSLATGAAEIGRAVIDSAIKTSQELYQAAVGEVPANQPAVKKCTQCTCENCQCEEGKCQCAEGASNCGSTNT